MSDRYHCSACEGTGRARLSLELQRTLDACRRLASSNEDVTSNAVRSELGERVNASAMSMRLKALERMAFLRRSGMSGHCVVWTVAPMSAVRPRFISNRGNTRVLYGGPPSDETV